MRSILLYLAYIGVFLGLLALAVLAGKFLMMNTAASMEINIDLNTISVQ